MSSSDAISDASPVRKKPKATQGNCTGAISDAEESSGPSSGHCLKDCGRNGCLKLCIENVNDFIRSEEDVEGDWTNISGLKWRITAAIDDGFLKVYVECESEVKAKWHCKAKYGVRLETRRPESSHIVHDCDLFDETHGSWGFPLVKTNELTCEEHGYVNDGAVNLYCDITTFSCYVTDGAYGERTRFHDVSFKFDGGYIYANKGFLAANSAFFEAMFFGEFGDKHKDEVTLNDIDAKDFARLLIAISPIPPGINDNKEMDLLRFGSRFQSDTLTDRCCTLLLYDEEVCEEHSFVARLELADELQLGQFRDQLISTATKENIDEAAQEENERCFSGTTWFKLFMKHKSFKA